MTPFPFYFSFTYRERLNDVDVSINLDDAIVCSCHGVTVEAEWNMKARASEGRVEANLTWLPLEIMNCGHTRHDYPGP